MNDCASAEEQRLFWEYFDKTPATEIKEELFDLAVFKMTASDPAPSDIQANILRRILHKEPLPETPETPLIVLNKKRLPAKYVVAAACIFLLIAGIWAVRSSLNSKTDIVSVQKWDTLSNENALARRVTLPDGTTILLNRHTTLLVSKDYSRNRLVGLDGEAYFDVVHSVSHPFRVQTGKVITTVLGTSFNIVTKNTSNQISLVQGSVRIAQPKRTGDTVSVLLVPGETAITTAGDESIRRMPTAVSDVAAWTKGDLVLNNVSLKEAIEKLNEQYHIRVTGSEQLYAGKAVSGIYGHSQPWEIVLKQILFIHGLHYQTGKEGSIHIIP